MAKILIETRLNSLKLNESQNVRKGCLGRIEGICADYANPTRNGRFYSKELWEHVFNDDLIKEQLESKTLIGELDHPEDRFEPLAKEACVVMTDYKFDDDKQVVYGGFDILDTPAGKILKSLLDYGCVMGVSSRGQGDITSNGEYEEVEPNSYEFACFDVVTTPAVATARQKVVESTNGKQKIKKLNDSITEQINCSTTLGELEIIERVIESTDLANIVSLKEAISNKRKSIAENSGKTISNKTANDLKEAKKELRILQKELDTKSSKTIKELSELRTSASNLSSQVLAYKHREGKLIESVEALNKRIKSQNSELRERKTEMMSLKKELGEMREETETLKESLSIEKEHTQEIIKRNTALENRLNSTNNRCESLHSQIKEKTNEIENLKEELSSKRREIEVTAKKSKESLTESNKKITNSENKVNSFKKALVESYCNIYSIDSKLVLDKAKSLNTPQDIEKYVKECVERIDRYSSLPFTNDSNPKATKILSENLSPVNDELDEEMKHSQWFLESVAGVNKN